MLAALVLTGLPACLPRHLPSHLLTGLCLARWTSNLQPSFPPSPFHTCPQLSHKTTDAVGVLMVILNVGHLSVLLIVMLVVSRSKDGEDEDEDDEDLEDDGDNGGLGSFRAGQLQKTGSLRQGNNALQKTDSWRLFKSDSLKR